MEDRSRVEVQVKVYDEQGNLSDEREVQTDGIVLLEMEYGDNSVLENVVTCTVGKLSAGATILLPKILRDHMQEQFCEIQKNAGVTEDKAEEINKGLKEMFDFLRKASLKD